MLDINLFRAEKGGNPDIIRESQRRRFAPVEKVDEVISVDVEVWDASRHSFPPCDLGVSPPGKVGCAALAVERQPSSRDETRT